MSWFEYGTPKRRSLRKNVWLRARSLPENILQDAKKNMRSGEYIERVVVCEIKTAPRVLLEFWCCNPLDAISNKLTCFTRYTVFHLIVDEDPNWICEGDLGRGYKG